MPNQPTTVTEWAIEYTWPDGYIEYEERDGRRRAEIGVSCTNERRDEGMTDARAVVVTRTKTRTVTVSPWVPATRPAETREVA